MNIRVLFFEVGNDTPFSEVELPVDNLPDTFEIETTIHIGEDQWRVCDARPANKVEFRESGSLSLYLALVKTIEVSPGDLLFSLPSISDDIAALVETASLENVLVVAEDDWRQTEIVAQDLAPIVAQELASIEAIYATQRVGESFRKLHVRKLVPIPFPSPGPTLEHLHALFGVRHLYAGVAFQSTAAVVDRGFAFQATNGWILWGQLAEGRVAVLCLHIPNIDEVLDSSVLHDFLGTHGLMFVDWNRLLTLPPIDDFAN